MKICIGMSSEDMFDHYTAVAAPSSRMKESKRHCGESSKAASKKARTEDHPPTATPSKETLPPPTIETTPPPSPLNQQSPPALVDQHPTPPTPSDQTPHAQPGDTLTSTVVSLARERIYKLSKHKHSQESIVGTSSMEADQIINRGLNEIASGLLTITIGWRRTGTLVTQTKDSDTKHTEAVKVLEGRNAELLEKNTELIDKNNELLEKKAQLTEELLECRAALNKSN